MNGRPFPLPVAALAQVKAYNPKRPACPTDLRLDGNEGRVPSSGLIQTLAEAGVEILRRYPAPQGFETKLAAELNLPAANVLVTAGADDSLDRIFRAFLDADRNLVVPVPTFVMIPRYARLAGAELRTVPWLGSEFPVDEVLEKVDSGTGVIAVVTPNNPTGAVITPEQLRQLSAGAPGALLLVDLAYGEFAQLDLMPTVLDLPNALAVHSMSKAWGLAGMRVGYVAGPEALVTPLRATGGPYAVSGPSLLMAAKALDEKTEVEAFVARIQGERQQLENELEALGTNPLPSQGNFVYARCSNPTWLRDALAGLGIAVRYFTEGAAAGSIRISCPGDELSFDRLLKSLRTALDPQALLFDMDGVLADVSGSYRRCILETASFFGADLTPEAVAAGKRQPGSNNDWVLTRSLLAEAGIAVDLEEVTAKFEEFYQDYRQVETLIPPIALLRRLAEKLPLAVVTGRPRRDAEEFLNRFDIAQFFSSVICLEDAPGKPDPASVALALENLGAQTAWMIGDTVNDIGAARAAGVLPLGVVPPGESSADYRPIMTAAGAGRILNNLNDLEEVLP